VLCISLHTNTHFTHAHPPLVIAREWSKKNCVSLCHMPSLQLSRQCQHGAQCQWPWRSVPVAMALSASGHAHVTFACAAVCSHAILKLALIWVPVCYLFVRLHDDAMHVISGVLCSEWLSYDELWCDVTCCDMQHCAALCCAACVALYVWTPALAVSCFVVLAVVHVASAFRCTPVTLAGAKPPTTDPHCCCPTHCRSRLWTPRRSASTLQTL
jgi:hypothetical protein